MAESSILHNTFVVERTYTKPTGKVFAALGDPAKKRRWFAESERHDVEVFDLDFRVGGRERASFRFKAGTPFAGASYGCDNLYLDIVDGHRVVMASMMEFGGRPISASLITFEVLSIEAGTRLIMTHQGAYFEGADGPDRRHQGWRDLLERLDRELVA
ncbi:MAG: SRPBCC family protein [Bryobacteraceae bacterium]|nr:SRPBCC family protein [Bryobacteraceae bacterium]